MDIVSRINVLLNEGSSIFYKIIGKYTLSIMRRNYETMEGSTSGIESVIFEGKEIKFMEGKNYIEQFERFKTDKGVTNFIEEKENEEN